MRMRVEPQSPFDLDKTDKASDVADDEAAKTRDRDGCSSLAVGSLEAAYTPMQSLTTFELGIHRQRAPCAQSCCGILSILLGDVFSQLSRKQIRCALSRLVAYAVR